MENDIILTIDNNGARESIHFILASSFEEKERISKVRAEVYSNRGYFSEKKERDEDQYDLSENTVYIYAVLRGEMVGALRIIREETLPTEQFFQYDEPPAIQNIQRSNRCEIGRLVVRRIDGMDFVPRNLIMLFLIYRALKYAETKNISGGVSFIKERLNKKLDKLKFPFHRIETYKQTYPTDGVLFNYFNDPSDKVIPIFFLTEEVKNYIDIFLGKKFIFKKISESERDEYLLRSNIYTKFLKTLGII